MESHFLGYLPLTASTGFSILFTLSGEEVILQIHKNCKHKLDADCVPCGYKCRDVFPVKSSGKRGMGALKEERDGFVIPENDKLIPVKI